MKILSPNQYIDEVIYPQLYIEYLQSITAWNFIVLTYEQFKQIKINENKSTTGNRDGNYKTET